MKVILDSNIFVADFPMKKPAFKVLFDGAKGGMLDVYVPEIVLDEVFNKFRQQLEKSANDISTEIAKINRLTERTVESPFTAASLPKLLDEYQQRVRKTLGDNKVTILPYPKTDHHFLAKKAMLSKKPFNSNEKGYRDCLIWENVKSLISGDDVDIASSPELVFITNNHTDFMAGDQLHADLLAELKDEERLTDSLILYQSLIDFNEKVSKLYLQQEDVLSGRLKNDTFWDFKLKAIIDKYLYDEFVGSNLGEFEFHDPSEYDDDEREITSFNDDYELKELTVKKLSADEFVVDLRIDLETDLDFFVDKHEHYNSSNVSYSVIDYDWNDHVIHVAETVTVPFTVSLIINSKLECDSIEINKIADDF